MNILIFSSVFFPAIGGIENHTVFLVKEFVKKGHQVIVITPQKQDLPLENVQVYEEPGLLKMISLFNWCNVFYMPNISLKGVWLLLVNPFKNWVISHNDFHFIAKNDMNSRLKLMMIKLASRNIAVSKSVADHLDTYAEVIYNCYEDAVFKIYEDENRVYDFIFVGRLVSQKGCDLLIRACSQLKHPFTLNIVGDGPEMPMLRQMASDLGIIEHVRFLGFLQNEELARMLNRHRVMIVPSMDKEGFGIVALEGLACGCEVIAADAGGLREAVDRFGKVFRMGSQSELTANLEDSLIHPRPGIIGPELADYLNHHKKVVVAGKYLAVFNKLS